MTRTIIQSFIISLLICGCLILLNYMCPFLSIKTDPISYTHSFGGIVFNYDSYNEIKYIGIFGVDNIIGTEEHFNEVEYSNTNKENYQYKKLNWITISIEFTIIFIILFIIFHKQRVSIDDTEDYDNKYSNSIKFIFMYRDESGNEIRATGSEFFDQEYEFKDLDLSNASIAHAFVIWKKKLQEKGQIEWEHINGSGSIFLKQIN